MKRILQFLLIFIYFPIPSFSDENIIAYGDSWKYLDNGSNQGNAWKGSSFNDAAWATGYGQFGYGDGDETTTLAAGCTPVASCSPKSITTYFRKTITIGSTASYSGYTLNVKRDDGVIVYIDSVEVFRSNMPGGAVTYTTLASAAAGDDGAGIQTTTISLATLPTGTHTIAVEIHQNATTSSDISFDLELVAVQPGSVNVLRGPYLNLATENSVHIRWRTNSAANSVVYYGTTDGALTSSVTDDGSVTDHEITLTGLSPDTRYYYSIGNTTPLVQTLKSGSKYFFQTLPVAGTERKTYIWAIGDCGNNSTNQLNVMRRYMQYMNGVHTDVMMLMGDNSYSNGTDTEYQTNFFPVYQDSLLRNVVLWPSPGNHDYANTLARQNDHAIPYYDMFTLPTAAEAGGYASGTEAFYSFDFANIHFISLDSYGRESNTYRIWDTLGPQIVWLKNDLAVNTQKWTIAYWHHPPYTLGSHSSESSTDLVNIRTNVLRILERNGVDLILCGHSHVYERSYFMNGHFGNEASFNLSSHGISTSRGWYNDSTNSCPYIKSSTQKLGTVYAVVGSSGQLGGAQTGWPHAAMVYSNNSTGGGLAITIEGNRLDGEWVCSDGVIRDRFTMMKDVKKKLSYTIAEGDSIMLSSSWKGIHNWTGGMTTDSVKVSPLGAGTDTLTVSDNYNCLVDSFIVTRMLILPVELVTFSGRAQQGGVLLNWSTASEWNNAYFDVEWSTDMLQFTSIGIVPGSGNSSELLHYEWLHGRPAQGVNYYRLKMVDRDSTFTYSDIAGVIFQTEQANILPGGNFIYVHPNPSLNGVYDVDYYSQKKRTGVLQVFNILGKLLYTDKLQVHNGITHYSLDLSAFSKGMYILAIDNDVIKIDR